MKRIFLALAGALVLSSSAMSHTALTVRDATMDFVGDVYAHHHLPGNYIVIGGFSPACYYPEPACLPEPILEIGEFRFVTDLIELHHYDRVYFSNSICGVGDPFWFTVDGNPGPADPEGRSAMYANAEWMIAPAPPTTLPVYGSYRDPLGPCITQSGTAPGQLHFYRERVTIRRGYTAPFILQ